MKICTKCGESKEPIEFNKQKRGALGVKPICRMCSAAYSMVYYAGNKEILMAKTRAWRKANPEEYVRLAKEYRGKNKEKIKASNVARYLANPEAVNASKAKWVIANPEKIKVISAAYYIANKKKLNADRVAEYALNPEKEKVSNAKWRITNPAKRAAARMRHIATKLYATPLWVDLKAIEFFYSVAARCTKATGISYHVDHIVPLQGKNVCGLHVHYNLQILTARANISKGNKYSAV